MHPTHAPATRIALPIIALLVALCAATPAFAHKVVVFATVEGDTIRGEAYFRGGAPVERAKVTVLGPDRNLLGETTTDDEGRFTFPVRSRTSHTLIVDAGEGHGQEYTVTADELPDNLPEAPSTSEPATPGPTTTLEPKPDLAPAHVDKVTLEARIDAVDKQVAAFRRDLNQYKSERRLQDVLGGVGYILGIMGVVFYFLGVKRKENRSHTND